MSCSPFRTALRYATFACVLTQFGHALAAPQTEAYVGTPFGVGRVTVDVLRGEPSLPLSDERFTVLGDEGRVLYPVLKEEPARRILRRLLDIESPRSVTIYYLFQGEDPFDLFPFTPVEQAVRVKPQFNQEAHRRLLSEWWKQYTGRWQNLQSDPQYPPIVENFLVATLSRRLALKFPEQKRSILPWKNKKASVFDELFVSESHQLRVDREMLSQREEVVANMQPLPESPAWSPSILPQEVRPDDVPVEAIATHVPQECFYIRFGNFTNYLWFRDLNKKWQGDLGNMILRRGIDRGASERIQQQLSLRESAMAKILGPQVIADAAIVGLDPYMNQGAAIGILFQAKNNFLLSNDLMKQRRESLVKFENAEETTVTMAEKEVSLISTPDGKVRSYYVQSGDFHFVTTSQTLVHRFLEAGQGTGSLASLPTFRHTRKQLSVDRDDTLFAFISPEFFQNLCSPHYWVETRRRVQSSREPHLMELAQLAGSAEGMPLNTKEELISAGILPEGFATRLDETELFETETGWIDSLRGAAGYYLPVADMPVGNVSVAESIAYQRFVEMFRNDIGQMPPIAVAAKRVPQKAGQGETMAIEVLADPIQGLKLGKLLTMLGDPSDQQLQQVAGDVVSMQAVLNSPDALSTGGKQPYHLFGALQDYRSPLAVQQGRIAPGGARTELVRGYVGTWPRLGLLEMLVGSARPVDDRPQQAGGDLWQAKRNEFMLLSFKPDVIDHVLPQLALVPADRPAQLRVKVEDLTDKQIADTVNALGYMRARETSVAASRLMNALANQLLVPRNECRQIVESLVDGKFVCPLGGEYQLYAPDLALEFWASSALPEQNRHLLAEVPEDFELSLLEWFRGLQGDLAIDDHSLRAHLEIDMTDAAVPW